MKIIKNSNIRLSLAILGITLMVAVFGLYISRSEATPGYLAASGNSSILQVGGGGVLGLDSPTNGMVIATGNVGIGTSTPSQKFEVVGDVSVSGNFSTSGSIGKSPTNPPLSQWLPEGTSVTYTTPENPKVIAFDGTNMWVGSNSASVGQITKISPTGIATTYDLDFYPSGIAFDGMNMWVTDESGDKVCKVSPTGVKTIYTGTGDSPRGIAFDGTNMWTVNLLGNSVTKITPAGTMTTYTGTGESPIGIAFDGTNMWTANGNSVTKITPAGAMTTYTGTGAGSTGIAFDGTNMWVSSSDNTVTKVNPTGVITIYPNMFSRLNSPYGMAFDGANMWTVNYNGGAITKISQTGYLSAYYIGVSGFDPTGIAFDGTNMWVTNLLNSSVTKILVNTR